MANLKHLRTRIKSIKSTSKITKAMQLVAATKLTKIKHEIGEAESYLNVITNISANIAETNSLEDLPAKLHKYFISSQNVVLLIIFTSEKGLCGGFNSAIIRNAKNDIKNFLKAQKKVKLIIIGNKGYYALKSLYGNLIAGYFAISKNNPGIFAAIKSKIIEMIDNEQYSECYLYFNKFKNALLQFFTKKQILPLTKIALNPDINRRPYEYEGDNLIEKLLNLYIDSQINYAILETKAGEEGARMSAMDNATRNANDLVDNLTIKLNRNRQASITSELIEIIAGAESV